MHSWGCEPKTLGCPVKKKWIGQKGVGGIVPLKAEIAKIYANVCARKSP